jgi:Asp-tRNA(Asn)/Glu-tRNA(Gln) amidotransferase C subunit
MEITSFILGVCAVIVLLMVVGTSVNYMTIKVLRKDIDTLSQDINFNRSSMIREFDTVKANYMHHIKKAIDYTDQLNNNTQDGMNTIYKTIDSKADKLDSRFRQDVESLIRELNILREEISRVERNKDERINY